jgi:hypothetical protein
VAPKKQTKQKQADVGTKDPTLRAAVHPPVSNTIRAARAARAANAPAPLQPPPIVLERTILEAGWDLIFGPYISLHKEKTPYVFELMGHSRLAPPKEVRDAIWPTPEIARQVPVRFGNLGGGEIWIYKDGQGRLHTPYTDQTIPFVHPELPEMETGQQFALTINIADGDVSGELVLTTDASHQHGFVTPVKRITEAELPSILGLEDLQDVHCWIAENQLGYGKFELDVMFSQFRLDGVFPQSDTKPSFLQVRDARVLFEAFADVEAKGVPKRPIEIERDRLGALSAHARLDGQLSPITGHKLFGQLETVFERGKFAATGRFSYVSDKIQGEIEVVLTELRAAREIARQRLGELAPSEPPTDDAPNGLALTGAGLLDFQFNKWLRGHAEVIVDPDGYVTTLGRIEPDAQIEVFKRQSREKTIYDDSGWGVTVVDIVPVPYWWGITLKAHAFVGPAMLGDIVIEGVFSTHPGVTRHFSIAGTLIIPGEVGADLDAYFKGGVPKLANAGGEISASAKVRLHAGVRPRIGWDRPGRSNADDAVSGRYFIDGEVFGGADVILGLRGGVTAQVAGKKASWKPLHHTWRLGRLRYRAGGKFILGDSHDPKIWTFDPNPKQKKADYEKLLDDASVARLPEGDGKEDPITPTWVEGVTDRELEPEGSTPPERQLGPVHIETPTLAGGDLPADEHVYQPAPAQPAPGQPVSPPSASPPPPSPLPTSPQPVPPEPPDVAHTPKTRPATEMPPPEPATPPLDLVVDFWMQRTHHQLFLTRSRTPQVLMASMPPRSPLAKRLRDALEELKMLMTSPPPTRSDIDLEHEWLQELYTRVMAVEIEARDLSFDVEHGIPDHFPQLHKLAEDLTTYADLFNRNDLLMFFPTAGARRAGIISVFDETAVLRKLEQLRVVPEDRQRIIEALRAVPVGRMVADHIRSGRFDECDHYGKVLTQLKNKREVGDTLVVLNLAAQLQDLGFKIVFEAQEDPGLIGADTEDVDIAGVAHDGSVAYAIAVKRPRDISTLRRNLERGVEQVEGAHAHVKAVVAYVAEGTENELRTTYRDGVTRVRDRNPSVEMLIVLKGGIEISAEDL